MENKNPTIQTHPERGKFPGPQHKNPKRDDEIPP